MKHSLKDIIGYSIKTKDGLEGKVMDILFDENNCVVRYLEADFGSFTEDVKVLIPMAVIKDISYQSKNLQLSITKKNIENCVFSQKKNLLFPESMKRL